MTIDEQDLLARLRRVCMAIPDPTTYTMLRLSMVEKLIKPEIYETGENASNEVRSADSDSVETKAIPKIIFQTWKTRRRLPSNFAYWRSSFSKRNPTYQHVLWDDDDNRRFVDERFHWFIDAYDRFPAEIFRADLIRFFFLYSYGGFYSDLDSGGVFVRLMTYFMKVT